MRPYLVQHKHKSNNMVQARLGLPPFVAIWVPLKPVWALKMVEQLRRRHTTPDRLWILCALQIAVLLLTAFLFMARGPHLQPPLRVGLCVRVPFLLTLRHPLRTG